LAVEILPLPLSSQRLRAEASGWNDSGRIGSTLIENLAPAILYREPPTLKSRRGLPKWQSGCAIRGLPRQPHLPRLDANTRFDLRWTMDAKEFIQKTVTEHPVVLFMKGTAQFPQCGFSGRAIQVLKQCGVKNLVTVNVLEDDEVRQGIKEFANWPTIPQLYVKGQFVGGSDIMMEMFESGELQNLLKEAQAA
jgi:monothiol glutaredoxin